MTYKNRLVFYVVLLVVLLVGMMMLSFKAARDVIINNSQDQLQQAARSEANSIHAELAFLLRDAEHIAATPKLRELLGGASGSPGGETTPPVSFDAFFAAFTGGLYQLTAADGTPLTGQQSAHTSEQISQFVQGGGPGVGYLMSGQAVAMVAHAPIIDAGQKLGVVMIGRYLDNAWLQHHAGPDADYLLFFGRDDRVLYGNHSLHGQQRIDARKKILHLDGQRFRLREVVLEGTPASVPRLWLGNAENRLFGDLPRYAQWVYLFTLLGGIAVLLVGWLMLRNFQRPFSQLMNTTQELLDGKLPMVARSSASTEMDQLVNRFADVLDTLRREQQELKVVHEKLQHTAITDSLTKLYNRRYLQEVTPGLFAQVERDQRYLTAILLDLDYFKDINDCHGHLAGDAVLVHFSRMLKHNSRVNDHLFRIGGEEFLILNVAENPQDSVALANKLRELVESSTAKYQGVDLPVTVSAGISCSYGSDGKGSLSQLLRGADKALYEAKAGGRNRVVLHSSCRSAAATAKRDPGIALVKRSSISNKLP